MHHHIASHRLNQHGKAPGQNKCSDASRNQWHTLVARHYAQYLTCRHTDVHSHKWHQGHDVELQHHTAPDQVEGIAQGEQRSDQICTMVLAVSQTNEEIHEGSS